MGQKRSVQPSESIDTPSIPSRNVLDIRAQLREWQTLHGHEITLFDPPPKVDIGDSSDPTNYLTPLPDDLGSRRRETQIEDESKTPAHFMTDMKEGFEGEAEDESFLRMGDLVEIEFQGNERESMLAIFVRRIMGRCQLYTMQGQWLHYAHSFIQYSVPGWVDPALVEPLLEHLPDPGDIEDLHDIGNQAYLKDLSVPRGVAAPLVTKMVALYKEMQEIYRQNASTLDNAHEILSHPSDLRYSSLIMAARTLLEIRGEKVPTAALLAVRRAFRNGGLGFGVHHRSHRLTGHVQIRSREQVRAIERARTFIRDWQIDMAHTSTLDPKVRGSYVHKPTAKIVFRFLERARAIVMENRQNRAPTLFGNVGPSSVRFPITKTDDSIKSTKQTDFARSEQDLIQLIEAWCCSGILAGLARLESLPPLLLQASGLYPDQDLGPATGFMFLQELGVIRPFENRIRFDQHLLIPSSQQSKPLANLMDRVAAMDGRNEFRDIMAECRHDWKDLPVYCIDDAGAHEIDDGMSVQKAEPGLDGNDRHWVHVHIANPTAFFDKDTLLAKMARHMGETIYTPDQVYMMLPRWTTRSHFSLGKDRPCLTFSAKIDEDGSISEFKITNGTVRNVITLTPAEVEVFLGGRDKERPSETVLTVGGEPPLSTDTRSPDTQITNSQVEDLKTLQMLAEKRVGIRQRAGGVFFDFKKPEVQVWQSWERSGLQLDLPWRRGSRSFVGDPVIQLRTNGLTNWFAPSISAANTLVREMMLIACEISASWCAERHIPIIYRGTALHPDKPDRTDYYNNVLAPRMNAAGEYPMHLGMNYIGSLGFMVLRSHPIRHKTLGMDFYSKATSPLRRYGDMILHWQIEAAIRHELETGKSLKDSPAGEADLSFLPFSEPMLTEIMRGLKPREQLIRRSQQGSEAFWISMLLFRMHHFGEDGGLPFKTLRAFVHTDPHTVLYDHYVGVTTVELNTSASMAQPQLNGLGDARLGDIWECKLEQVDVYRRITFLKPLRLVERVD